MILDIVIGLYVMAQMSFATCIYLLTHLTTLSCILLVQRTFAASACGITASNNVKAVSCF